MPCDLEGGGIKGANYRVRERTACGVRRRGISIGMGMGMDAITVTRANSAVTA